MATEMIPDGNGTSAPSQAPQTLDKSAAQEPVPASIRVMSLLAFAIFAIFGATTKNWVPELGLAFVTGGALLATPQLVAVLVASRKRSSAFSIHLRRVTFLGVIVLGILVFKARPQRLAEWKLFVLFAAALLEVLILLVLVPFWLGGSAKTVFSSEKPSRFSHFMGKVIGSARRVIEVPERWVATVEEDNGFLILGAGLFLVGTMMQFVAGA